MRQITKSISIPVNGNNQTVEAPVSISVTAAGTDPEAAGRVFMMRRSSICCGHCRHYKDRI